MISQKRKLLLSRINKIGAFISTTQADEMIERYHNQQPGGVGSFLYDATLFQQLLSVHGCEGIRVINAIHDDVHTLVFVAVDSLNRNISDNAPIVGHGTALSYAPLQIMQELPVTGVDKWHGTVISKMAGSEMIEAYQALVPGSIKSSLYGRELFAALLSIEGCTTLRVCNGIDDEGDHKTVLIPLDAKYNAIRKCQIGAAFIDDPIGDNSITCPPWCPTTDFMIL
ncbi:hypothetical protein [Chitinophaga sp.]|uniref:hypothetical protein n=1 Tax=Chitinophaga sp. TaxID=1869181 RepID=UPI0031E282C6